jgi:hypothetical protein
VCLFINYFFLDIAGSKALRIRAFPVGAYKLSKLIFMPLVAPYFGSGANMIC